MKHEKKERERKKKRKEKERKEIRRIKKKEKETNVTYAIGNVKFAECFCVCRVYSLGHSANKLFAECCHKNTRQKKNTR